MTIYDFTVTTITGDKMTLDSFRDQVLLIVNVASKCGFTPQYAGLELLYRRYREDGFAVLGFPCNQFGNQEPGDGAEIKSFCELNYGVSFPLFARIDVNGSNADLLYKYLKSEQKGLLGSESIKWNFTKFLVDRKGKVIKRFGSTETPEEIEKEIKPLLKLNSE